MSSGIPVTWQNGRDYFYLERLNTSSPLNGFHSPIQEYNEY
jgi:hypothetical protein